MKDEEVLAIELDCVYLYSSSFGTRTGHLFHLNITLSEEATGQNQTQMRGIPGTKTHFMVDNGDRYVHPANLRLPQTHEEEV
jgi:hypothetical protein